MLDRDGLAISELYFKTAISKVIMFRAVEKMVSDAPWYDGGYRAQTVTYSIAYLSALFQYSGLVFNFESIWKEQALPKALIKILENITQKVYKRITNPPSGHANISQWTKQESCWLAVKDLAIDIDEIDESLCVTVQEKLYKRKEDSQNKKIDNNIDKQVKVLEITDEIWVKMYDYFKEDKSVKRLSSKQIGVLESRANGRIIVPSEMQSKILFMIYETALDEGAI